MGLCCVALSVSARSFNRLWNEYEKAVEADRPETAFAVAQQILQKALQEHQQGQFLSASLAATAMQHQWMPENFFLHIDSLESLRARETDPALKAIEASILAGVYLNNRYRAAEAFDSAATANILLSLRDPEMLAAVSTQRYLPFVSQSALSKYYHHDLLHLLWQRFVYFSQQSRHFSADIKDSVYAAVKAVYEAQHNDDALVLLGLDMKADAQQLLQQYPEARTGAEVYLTLLESRAEDSLKVAWAQTALKRYPRYERIGAVEAAYNRLRQPRVTIVFPQMPYPEKTYSLYLRFKNAQKFEGELLRLPDEFDENTLYANNTDPVKTLRKAGVKVDEITQKLTCSSPYQFSRDTLSWQAPAPGRYAFIYTASTKASFAQHRKAAPLYEILNVSSMQALWSFVQKNLHFIVVDAETGRPLPDITLSLYQIQKNSERKFVKEVKTNCEGTVTITPERGQYIAVVQRDDHDKVEVSAFNIYEEEPLSTNQRQFELHFYTDRAVYYPGQTVHVGGIAFMRQGSNAQAVTDSTFTLTLKDANGAAVASQTVTTDAFGTLDATFTLPRKGLPGYYSVNAPHGFASFQVQEYQRPTFEITLKQGCEVDTVRKVFCFSGRVMGLNGVPLRHQLVWARLNNPAMPDSIFTDSIGVFAYETPISKHISTNGSNSHLTFSACVMHSSGETHEATTYAYWRAKPLTLNMSVPNKQTREALKPIKFSLVGQTNQPLDGTIQWKLFAVKDKKVQDEALMSSSLSSSSSSFSTDTLRTLPSGNYKLTVFAQAGNDTVSASRTFYLTGLTDKKLPSHRDLWLCVPNTSWSNNEPIQVQFGTSLTNATIFCELISDKGVVRRKIYELSDSLVLLSMPYDSCYGEHVRISFCLVNGENTKREYADLFCLKEKQLHATWTTFRDHAQPGDNVTWKLRLTHTDGTPAPAQLMCTLYDAALDVWAGHTHTWYDPAGSFMNFYYPYHHWNDISRSTKSLSLYFPLKEPRRSDATFDEFNPEWSSGLDYVLTPYGNGRIMRSVVSAAKGNYLDEVYYTEYSSSADALQSRVAGVDLNAEEENIPATTLRKNFDETAYFAPRLVADATGEVTLNFTLPESLTSWRFLGLGHTKDLQSVVFDTLLVAQKTLMAQCYAPQFVRQGDRVILRGTLQNLCGEAQSGNATWELVNPLNNKVLLRKTVPFQIAANADETVDFSFEAPKDLSLLTLRFSAASKDFSDGESHDIAVLPVTAVTPLIPTIYAPKPTLTDSLVKLSPLSTTREDAITLSRCLGSNLLGRQWVEKRSDVRLLLEGWKQQSEQKPDVLMGRLQQNEILWDVLLTETPFLPAAQRETEARHELLQLLDAYNLHQSIVELTEKLKALQHTDGGFSWYPGMSSNVYVTNEVLQNLRAVRYDNDAVTQLLERAEAFLKAKNYKPGKPLVRHLNPAISNPGATQKAMELSVNTVRKNGYEIVIRYLVTVHRDLQFVRLAAPRAANVSVQDTQSGYRFQGGLSYYRACRAASTDYYFEYLPQGVYQIEERTYEEREGEYHTGTPALQSLYEVP